MTDNRARFTERQAPAQTPDKARRRRSTNMIGIGVLAFAWGLIAAVMGGNPGAILLAVLGVGLLVGGLVIRR